MHIGQNKKKLLFVLRTSKTHGEDNLPQTIKINSLGKSKRNPSRTVDAEYDMMCPYMLLRNYITLRKKSKI